MGTYAKRPSGDAVTSCPVVPPSGTLASTLPAAGSTIARLLSPFCATSNSPCCAYAPAEPNVIAKTPIHARIPMAETSASRNEYTALCFSPASSTTLESPHYEPQQIAGWTKTLRAPSSRLCSGAKAGNHEPQQTVHSTNPPF